MHAELTGLKKFLLKELGNCSNEIYTWKFVVVHTKTIIGLDCPPVSRIILPHIAQDHKKT